MKKFWSGHRETRRSSQALFPGKGRRFKSDRPHQDIILLKQAILMSFHENAPQFARLQSVQAIWEGFH
jgi:hypothetical protein